MKFHRVQITHLGLGFTWTKDKDDRDWVAVSCEGEEQEFGGLIKTILQLRR